MAVTKFTVTLFDPRDSSEIPVEINHAGVLGTSWAIIDAAPEIIEAAIIKVRGREPDRADHVHATSIAKRSGTSARHVVEAIYPSNGGPFSDSVEAIDLADAEFQIMWTMAENNDIDPINLSELLSYMRRITIYDTTIQSTLASDREHALLTLYEAVEGNGDLEDAKTMARGVLEDLGLLSVPAPTR